MPSTQRATHRRRSIRLREYDYAQAGAYFVTVCAHQRACLFGAIARDAMRVNAWGAIVQACWEAIPQHFPEVELDAFVVMPNHIHGILIRRGTACRAPTQENFGKPVSGSIPTIVRSFKSAVTREINLLPSKERVVVWQRSYYEHVIRDERDLQRVRQYIAANPLRWALDQENPRNK